MEIQILPAKPEQAKALTQIALAAKAHWGYPERWMELWRPQLTFTSAYFEKNESWVAELNGISVAFYTLLQKDGNAWVEDLWVSPELIGKGIGKSLFLHALNISRQRGFKKLQLEADPNAVGFYEKMGMYKIGERRYELEGQLRILPKMEIKL
jgi:ribosomal protein S18 acetylase RimI-like enzyme